MRKRFIFISIIIGLNLSIAFAGCEIYNRAKHGETLAFKAKEMAYRTADFGLHHSLIPNAKGLLDTKEFTVPYNINSLGLRDREYSLKKPANTYRILVLGDSFAEGYGVPIEDAFVKVLERKLNQSAGNNVKYEVINGGVTTYSPLLEYLFLKQKGLQLEPDMVLLFYSIGDLVDDSDYERTTVFDEQGLPLACLPRKRVRKFSNNPIEQFLIKYSRSYIKMEAKINNFLYKKRRIGLGRYFGAKISGSKHRLYKKSEPLLEMGMFAVYQDDLDKEIIKSAWEKNEKYINLIHNRLKRRGIPFALSVIPFAHEVSGSEWLEGRKAHNFAVGKKYPRPIIVNYIQEYAQKEKIPFINLYPYFEKSELKPLYFEWDGHFTVNGHKVAGEAIFAELKRSAQSSTESVPSI